MSSLTLCRGSGLPFCDIIAHVLDISVPEALMTSVTPIIAITWMLISWIIIGCQNKKGLELCIASVEMNRQESKRTAVLQHVSLHGCRMRVVVSLCLFP
jgi:hypothetical protein